LNRPILGAFLLCQAAGEICSWIWNDISNWLGPSLWVASVVLLLPGDLIVTSVMEKCLWESGMTFQQLRWMKILFEILVNGLTWALILYGATRLRSKRWGDSSHHS
jgi:hypothetical protein